MALPDYSNTLEVSGKGADKSTDIWIPANRQQVKNMEGKCKVQSTVAEIDFTSI